MGAIGRGSKAVVVLIAQFALLGGQVAVWDAELAGLWHATLAALQALFALALVFGPRKVGELVEEVGDAVRGEREERKPAPPEQP